MIGIKLVLLVVLLGAAALSGALPLRRHGRRDAPRGRAIAWGNAFTAGVFLGAAFVHMLPDADAAWRALGWDYPIGFLLAASAIVGMLLVEHALPPDDAHHALHAPADGRFEPLGPHGGSKRSAYAILVALSIHALSEGLALGAQREIGGALVIFAAILAHKSLEGFALGVSLARGDVPKRRAWGLLGLFAAATPVGVLAGAGVEIRYEGATRLAWEAVFLSLAAGTFAYVATLDILREEFHDAGDRLVKWCWVVAGTGVMALLGLGV
jgi:zinc transporter 1/2/3